VRYRIQVRSRVSSRVGRYFPGFETIPHGPTTDLVGELHDQADLFSMLDRLRRLGLEIVSLIPDE
jgi:hypothetical protein